MSGDTSNPGRPAVSAIRAARSLPRHEGFARRALLRRLMNMVAHAVVARQYPGPRHRRRPADGDDGVRCVGSRTVRAACGKCQAPKRLLRRFLAVDAPRGAGDPRRRSDRAFDDADLARSWRRARRRTAWRWSPSGAISAPPLRPPLPRAAMPWRCAHCSTTTSPEIVRPFGRPLARCACAAADPARGSCARARHVQRRGRLSGGGPDLVRRAHRADRHVRSYVRAWLEDEDPVVRKSLQINDASVIAARSIAPSMKVLRRRSMRWLFRA